MGKLTRRTLLSVLGIVSIGSVAAGCSSSPASNGVASKSPAQIVQAAVTAMKAAKSVHISGSISNAGKTTGIDATTFANGDIDGSISQNANSVDIVKIGNTDYIKTTESFYEAEGASSSIAALMAGKWIELPDSSAGFGQQFTLVALANSIQKNHTKTSAGTTSTVNGIPVVSVIDSNNGTLYVATTGPAYPVEVTGSSTKTGTGTITLTQWNKGKIPTPPPGARTPASFG
jgi:hypothetical protein